MQIAASGSGPRRPIRARAGRRPAPPPRARGRRLPRRARPRPRARRTAHRRPRSARDFADGLAVSRLVVEPAFTRDHKRRAFEALVEAQQVEHERRRRGRASAPRCAQRPPAIPPAAPVIGTPRGSRGASRANVSSRCSSGATSPGPAPFCGPKTAGARSNGIWTSQITVKGRSTHAARSAASTRARVRARAAARGDEYLGAPARAAATISSPVPRLVAPRASRSRPRAGRARWPRPRRPPPGRLRAARTRRAAAGRARLERPPRDVVPRARGGSPRPCRRRRRRPAAPDRRARPLDAAPDRLRDRQRAVGPLELVGRDEHVSRHGALHPVEQLHEVQDRRLVGDARRCVRTWVMQPMLADDDRRRRRSHEVARLALAELGRDSGRLDVVGARRPAAQLPLRRLDERRRPRSRAAARAARRARPGRARGGRRPGRRPSAARRAAAASRRPSRSRNTVTSIDALGERAARAPPRARRRTASGYSCIAEPQPAALVDDRVDVVSRTRRGCAARAAWRARAGAGVHRQRAAAALRGRDHGLDAVAREHAQRRPADRRGRAPAARSRPAARPARASLRARGRSAGSGLGRRQRSGSRSSIGRSAAGASRRSGWPRGRAARPPGSAADTAACGAACSAARGRAAARSSRRSSA